MKQSQDYILVIGQPLLALPGLSASVSQPRAMTTAALQPALDYPVIAVDSPSQAIAQARAEHPYLVILAGDDCQARSPHVVRQIRQSVQPEEVVIVALTESSELSWPDPKGNDEAQADIDGFFVAPLSADVLSALNESAIAQKNCSSSRRND